MNCGQTQISSRKHSATCILINRCLLPPLPLAILLFCALSAYFLCTYFLKMPALLSSSNDIFLSYAFTFTYCETTPCCKSHPSLQFITSSSSASLSGIKLGTDANVTVTAEVADSVFSPQNVR